MKIKHEKWGVVEGVKRDTLQVVSNTGYCTLEGYSKNGSFYLEGQGWSLVKEEKWEDVTGEVEIENSKHGLTYFDWKGINSIDSEEDFRFSLTHMYDLPEDWWGEWMVFSPKFNHQLKAFPQFMEQFKKPCIIVERKVG